MRYSTLIVRGFIAYLVVMVIWAFGMSLQSCASLHLGVKAKHSNDNTTATKTVSQKSFDSIGSLYQNQNAQMQQLQMILTNNNVVTNTTSEDADSVIKGGKATHGKHGGDRTSISTSTKHDPAYAYAEYFYDADSIYIFLHVNDETINIHRRTSTVTDLSKVSSTTNTSTATNSTTANAVAVHSDSTKTADSKTHNKQSSSVEVAATAQIGGKGYWLALVALVAGVAIGLAISRIKKEIKLLE